MIFKFKSPGWKADGQEPTELKETGWQVNQKPPAGIFNWFWKRVSDCISELQGLVQNLDNGKASVSHQHSMDDVAELNATVKEINTNIKEKANSTHTHTAGAIASGVLDSARLPTVPISKGGTGAITAATALEKLGAQAKLNFVPVQQSGGTDQLDNKIYIGWSGKQLKAQVDATDMGAIITDGAGNGAILPVSKGGTGATSAAAAESKIMPVSNITSGNFVTEIASGASLTGAYIKKYGKRINASFKFANVTASANCKLQIFKIASAYRTAGSHVGIVNVMTFNGNTYSRACGFINVGEKDGIVTIVLPTAGATYSEVEIFMDYYIN